MASNIQSLADDGFGVLQDEIHGAWTLIDASHYPVEIVGEDIGAAEGQGFAGWYTDTAAVDPDTGTIVAAWARQGVGGYDYIYLAFFVPVDTDGDESPEAYQKIVKLAASTQNLESLDSITIGTVNGQKYVLLTWTYYDSNDKNNVAGAVFSINGELQWRGTIRSTSSYEEYSRSCYTPSYNGGNGGFLIIWYTSYDKSIDGKWLYYDSSNGWTLTSRFDIADTNNLYYKKADQMLCIGGSSKALVVYRKYDSSEKQPDLYASLVDVSGTIQEVKLYDYDGAEETIGVRGAYGSGYFLVPIVSGSRIRYDIVAESDGSVYHRDYVTGNGEHPYAIYAGDRFVLVWIDHYNDDDGEPKIANIDTSNFYIHPQYGVSLTGGDTYIDKHPIVAYFTDNGAGKALVVWSNSTSGSEYDISYALVNLNSPTENPSVAARGVLVEDAGDQVAHGLGALAPSEFIVAYTDTSDGEEDLLAYVALPGSENVPSITLYRLPADADTYKQKILDIINQADSEILIAVAFWNEGDNPCETPGTIAHAIVEKKQYNPGIDIKIILDNDTDNDVVKTCLASNGISVIDDTAAADTNHIMHDKFMIVDGSKLIVATVNFIVNDFDKNNNTAIYVESKALSYFYRLEFLHMWNNGDGRFGVQKTEDHSFIVFTQYGERRVIFEGYFSPQSYGDRGRLPNTVAGFIDRASSSVYFSSFIFTTSGWVTPLYDAIVNANSRGVIVRGVFDEAMNVDVPGRRLYWLIDNNVPVAIDIHAYSMHAKLFAIDDTVAVLGSWNPTKSGTTVHDENILLVRDPDTSGGVAKHVADYINSMYSDSEHFASSPYQYNPPHLVITKVMFYPAPGGSPNGEWVEIHNPASTTVYLAGYAIGDVDNLIAGDSDPTDGLYKFPSDAQIPPGGYIVVAYNATAFYQEYGFKPNYEITENDPEVPNLEKYDATKFPGDWNLTDGGDEVLLVKDRDGFLQVIDAVWWGSSTYMQTSIGQPNSGAPLDTSSVAPGDAIVSKKQAGGSDYFDAIRMSDKYAIQSEPIPIPEPPTIPLVSAAVVIVVVVYLTMGRRR